MILADGRIDGVNDRHTGCQVGFLVESHFGWQTDESCGGHMDGLVSMMV